MATKKKAAAPAKKRYRSAVTGKAVSKSFAEQNPDTTYSTRAKKKDK